MKKKVKCELNINMRFTLLVMAELVVIAIISWVFAEIIKITFNAPTIVSLVVLSVVIGGGVNSFFSKHFFAPIMKLGKAMHQVAEGDFSIRLDAEKEIKEIKEIYSNFNLMAKELGATEILQTDFVSNVSHEFKTPINAIEGYATLLQGSDQMITDEQKTYIDKILLNTRRLSHLVGNILLLSKIDNQAIQSRQTKFRLDEEIRQSIVMLEPQWSKKDIEFDVDLKDVDYIGNEGLLHHVWDNLIENAVKFSPQGGEIRIKMVQEKEKIVVSVEDHGPGISEEAKKHIFDKFYQSDSSHKEEGNGLGLALVKQILNISNGEITVENIPDGGSRFTVTLKKQAN